MSSLTCRLGAHEDVASGPFIEDRFLVLVLASRSFPWSALLTHITASDTWLLLVLKLP